jgi:hypothetical protein
MQEGRALEWCTVCSAGTLRVAEQELSPVLGLRS